MTIARNAAAALGSTLTISADRVRVRSPAATDRRRRPYQVHVMTLPRSCRDRRTRGSAVVELRQPLKLELDPLAPGRAHRVRANSYFLTQITRTTDAFASADSACRVDAVGLQKVAHRVGRHSTACAAGDAIGGPRHLNRLQQRDAGESAVAIKRGRAGKAECGRRRQRDIAAAAKLYHRSLDAGHRGAAALILRIGNAGEVERRLVAGLARLSAFSPRAP